MREVDRKRWPSHRQHTPPFSLMKCTAVWYYVLFPTLPPMIEIYCRNDVQKSQRQDDWERWAPDQKRNEKVDREGGLAERKSVGVWKREREHMARKRWTNWWFSGLHHWVMLSVRTEAFTHKLHTFLYFCSAFLPNLYSSLKLRLIKWNYWCILFSSDARTRQPVTAPSHKEE